MSTSDFSPGHRALPRIFANPKESQLAEITQLLFQSGSWSLFGATVLFFQTPNASKENLKVEALTCTAHDLL
jgi:hypothetical protein